MKRGVTTAATRTSRRKKPKVDYNDTAAASDEAEQENSKKGKVNAKKGGTNKRGMTDGYADALKNYEGSYKSPAVATPTVSAVSCTDAPKPKRNAQTKVFSFNDHPEFRPNLSPSEVLQLGSFGGTYFRKIYSSASGKEHSNEHKEFPSEWFEGLKEKTQLTSSTYR
jgi:hypothetical protein